MKVWVAVAHLNDVSGVSAIAAADTPKAARAKLAADVEANPNLDAETLIFDLPVEVEVVQEYKR